MEKADILRKKREATRKRKKTVRKDTLMIAYINKKYPMAYKEAELYYGKLNQANPTKIDLRKTKEFRLLKQMQPETAKDGMILQIPITASSKQTQPDVETALPNPNEMALPNPNEMALPNPNEMVPDDLQNIQGMFEDHLPQDLLENMVRELREDLYIDELMNEVEIELNNEINILNDIEIDDRLEEELATLL